MHLVAITIMLQKSHSPFRRVAKEMPLRKLQRGLSLVELMVGATIALIALLVVSTVVTTSNQQNKITLSGSDAQTTGAMAAFSLERDIKMAGGGLIFPSDVPLPTTICEIHAYDNGAFQLSMAPLLITANAANVPDDITVFYASSSQGTGFPTSSVDTFDMADPTRFSLNNNGMTFHPGNLFIVAPVSDVADQLGDAARPDCYLGENTAPRNTSPLSADTGDYTLIRGEDVLTVTPQYNNPIAPGGSPINFVGGAAGVGAQVFNLGNRPGRDAQNRLTCDLGDCPAHRTYSIVNNELTMTENLLEPALRTAWPIASNVVMMKAQYGKDTNGDGAIDSWDTTLGDPPQWAQWNQVRAIRFGLITRGKSRDPEIVTPASLNVLPAFDAAPAVAWALPVANDNDARHYRYRSYQTVVPIRNNLWRQ